MKALFVVEQYPDCNPELASTGISWPVESYVKTWKELSGMDAVVCHYDNRHTGDTMANIWKVCELFNPAFVLFTEVFGHPSAQLHAMWPMLAKAGIPVVVVWHDSVKGGFRNLPGVALNVLADTRLPRADIPNSISLWPPHSEELFYRGTKVRDIDILFCSSRGHKPIAQQWIADIESRGLKVMWVGGMREQKLTLNEVADLCRRAKIGINFSQDTANAPHQLKGRVMDILCTGGMLLEQKNPHTWQMLQDGKDYVAFDSPFSLWDQAQHHLAHEDIRLAVAESGYNRSRADYSSKNWWSAVLSRIGKSL